MSLFVSFIWVENACNLSSGYLSGCIGVQFLEKMPCHENMDGISSQWNCLFILFRFATEDSFWIFWLFKMRDVKLTASIIAENLLVFPPEHVIYADYAYEVWDAEMIKYILEFFNPGNMRVDILTKSLKKSRGNAIHIIVTVLILYLFMFDCK